jgi:hypothetical protein
VWLAHTRGEARRQGQLERLDGEAITDARLSEVRPIQITKVINRNAYRLELSNSMKVHDVFHVSLPNRCQLGPDQYIKPSPGQ